MKKEKEENLPKGVALNDDELDRVNGGLVGAAPETEPCPYCGKMFPKSELEQHKLQCPKRPKTRFIF